MLSSKNLNQNMLKMRHCFGKKSPNSEDSALRPPQPYPHQLYCYKTF